MIDWQAILDMTKTTGWQALLLDMQNTQQEWELYQRTADIDDVQRLKWSGRMELLQSFLDTEQRARSELEAAKEV